MNSLMDMVVFVGDNVLYALPFFVVSIGLSVLVQMLRMDGLIKRAFANKIGLAILLATLVGAFSPLCSCTVIPVVGGLLASGVPLAPIMAFWIASPTMDPEILTLSIGLLGLPLAVTRLVAALVLSLGAGYVTWLVSRVVRLQVVEPVKEAVVVQEAAAVTQETAVSLPVLASATCCSSEPVLDLPVRQPAMAVSFGSMVAVGDVGTVETADSCNSKDTCALPVSTVKVSSSWWKHIKTNWHAIDWREFSVEMARESWKWGRWLLVAFVMEALILRYVPQETVAQGLGSGNWFAIPLAAFVGIPLYLTEMSALPIVSGLLAQGMAPGAAIAFLIAGPVTTLPAMTAVFGIVNRRIFALYMAVGLGGAILMGILSNWVLVG